MSGLTRTTDLIYTLRFLRLLTTKWEDTEAYKHGIIDETGKVIKLASERTKEDKNYFNLFHRLVFNLKRLLQKIPIVGKSIVTNYITALLMLKENYGISENVIQEILNIIEKNHPLTEQKLIKGKNGKLLGDALDKTTGFSNIKNGDRVQIIEEAGILLGRSVYLVKNKYGIIGLIGENQL